MRRLVVRLPLAGACALLVQLPVMSAGAQSSFRAASAPALESPWTETGGWHFAITPYAWLSGLTGRVGVGRVATNVDLSVGDVLSSLKFAAMATTEARHGSWVLLTDGVYASTENGAAIAFRGDTGAFTLAQRQVIVQPTAGYTVGNDVVAIDGLLGARYWYLGMDLGVDRTRRPTTTERSDSRQWVDATAGARIRWSPSSNIHVTAGGDGGAGGSQSTWQAYGSFGVDPWEMVTIGLGYRVLSVNYDHADFLFDTRTSGATLGAIFHL
jgi:hypothetical protein